MGEALSPLLPGERPGSGRPLVLIHGLGGPGTWQKLSPLLAAHFSVTSVELPGFGGTAPADRPLSTGELAGRIAASLPELPVLIGTSYGGQLAVEIAASGHASALVLAASTGLFPKHRVADSDAAWAIVAFCIRWGALRSRTIIERSSRRSFYDLRNRPAGLVEGFRHQLARAGGPESWMAVLRNAVRRDAAFEEKLCSLRVPTLIVAGREDRIVPLRAAERMHALIPGSRLEILERCGHAVALEQPEPLRDLIIAHAGG